MPVRIPVRLRSLEDYLVEVHGSVRQLTVRERRILRQWVRTMELAIEQEWPVDTGTSRDGWRSEVRASTVRGEGIGFVLWNDVYYVQWIRRAGEKAAGLGVLWRRLVPQVVRRYRDAMMQDLREEVRRTEAALATGADFTAVVQAIRLPGVSL